MSKGSNFWVIGGEFGSMNFHKLVEGSAQVQGPFKTRKEAEDAWAPKLEAELPDVDTDFGPLRKLVPNGAPA